MKIVFTAVGSRHDRLFVDAVDEFTSRIGRYVSVEWKIVAATDLFTEGKALSAFCTTTDVVVLLDEKGEEFSSTGFAEFLQKRFNAGPKRVVFVIGGSYGVSPLLRGRADYVVSLSRMTLPHQLVRLVLAEQVYRALSILRGEKYHHE